MPSAFVLALVSGLAHAAWNALAKGVAKSRQGDVAFERSTTVAALMLALVTAVLLRPLVTGSLPMKAWPWVLMAGAGEALYVHALGHAYSKGDLSLTYSVSRATALVFIWPLSWLAFGSAPGWLSVVATALVAGGIMIARKASKGSAARWHPGWTLLTGLAVGVYHTGYKGAVSQGADQVSAFIGALVIAVSALLLLIDRDVRRAVPQALRRPGIIAAGVLCAASFLLMLTALTTSESGRILGVRNTSVGFALIIALAQGERLTARQWLGLGVLAAGVGCFALQA